MDTSGFMDVIGMLGVGLLLHSLLRGRGGLRSGAFEGAIAWGLGSGAVAWLLCAGMAVRGKMPLYLPEGLGSGIFPGATFPTLLGAMGWIGFLVLHVVRTRRRTRSAGPREARPVGLPPSGESETESPADPVAHRLDDPESGPSPWWRRPAPPLRELWLLAAIGGIVACVTVTAITRPLERYDAIANFGMKSRILAAEQTFSGEAFTELARPLINRRYPILIPTLEASISARSPGRGWKAYKVIFPVFFLGILALVYGAQRPRATRVHALLFTLLVASVPHLASRQSGGASTGYADIPFAFFAAASLFVTASARANPEGSSRMRGAFLGGILLGMATLTKQEGMILGAAMVGALGWDAVSSRRREDRVMRDTLLFGMIWIAAALIVMLPWWAIRSGITAPDRGEVAWYLSNLDAAGIGTMLGRIPTIISGALAELLTPGRWALVWPALAISGGVLLRNRSSGSPVGEADDREEAFARFIRMIAVALLLHLLLYLAFYLITPHHVGWHVRSSFRRLLIHLTPAAILLISEAARRAGDLSALLESPPVMRSPRK